MLYAILLNDRDQLVAAAPAMDVHTFGAAYWTRIWPRPLPRNGDYSVALQNVSDSVLREKLDSLAFDDRELEECRVAIARLLGTDETRSGSRGRHPGATPRPPRAA